MMSDALLADVMRRGLLSAPMVVKGGPPPRLPVASLSQILTELRGDRDDR